MATRWCKQFTKLPVIVKLTPNVADIKPPALAAHRSGADVVSLINTINSVMGVDLDALLIHPHTGRTGSHDGYCGPAVKPIALHMVAEIARTPAMAGLPISGIGGIVTWKDAAEYMALGCGNVQVCTAAMTHGFRIVEDLCDGLSAWMDRMGFERVDDFRGRAVPSIVDWNQLDLNHVEKAVIDQDLCIACGRCHIVCEDISHQAITAVKDGKRHFEVRDDECLGCNLCVSVCPVPDCITMHLLPPGAIDPRTGVAVAGTYANWTTHPNNPSRA